MQDLSGSQGGAGPLRAASVRSGRGRVIPRGGSSFSSSLPAAEKESPPFFIVKDAVECDGLISNGPGRGRTRAKQRSSGLNPPVLPPSSGPGWECLEDLVPGSVLPPGGSLWINSSLFCLDPGDGAVQVNLSLFGFLSDYFGAEMFAGLPEGDPVSSDCRSLNCGKFSAPPPPSPPPSPSPPLKGKPSRFAEKKPGLLKIESPVG